MQLLHRALSLLKIKQKLQAGGQPVMKLRPLDEGKEVPFEIARSSSSKPTKSLWCGSA